MQIIETKSIYPRNGVVRERQRRVWPALLLVAAILAGISSVFGASAALMTAGICGAVVTLAVIPSVKRALWAMNPSAWRFFFLVWFAVTLGLCLSFVISSKTSHRVASEARATVMALGLCAAWFAVTRMKRASGAFKFAATLAIAEIGRLTALGIRPQPVSYLIWIAAALVAWRTFTCRQIMRGVI